MKNLINATGNFLRRNALKLVAIGAVGSPMVARADYTVPAYLSTALTDAGLAFAAIIGLAAAGILTATVGKGGLKMVISWVGKFFRG